MGGKQEVGRTPARRARILAVLAASTMVAAGCGAQLPKGVLHQLQAQAVSGGGSGGGGAGASAGAQPGLVNGAASGPTAGATGSGSTGAGSGVTGAGATSGSTGSAGPAASSSSGGAAAPVSAGECAQWGTGAPGLSASQLQVSTADTDSGPLPGATAGEFRGAAAYLAMVNASGGVCGRKIVDQELDDGLDPAQGRAQFEKIQPHVFGFTGNLSVADSGYTDLIKSTGVPWVGAVVDPDWSVRNGPNVSPHSVPSTASDAPWVWIRQQHPGALKAALLYTDVSAVVANLPPTKVGMQKAGYNISYTAGLNPTAPDYTPQVLSMASNGVQVVWAFSLEVNMQARLERDMAQQGFHPAVQGANLAYDTDYQQLLGAEGNGWMNPLVYAPFLQPGAAANYPGLADFVKWTGQTFPGAKNDLFSVDGWAYTALFVQALRAVQGPLTRQSYVAALQKMTQDDGGGLEPPINPSNPAASVKSLNCFAMASYQNGNWTVIHPTSGAFDCSLGTTFTY
ncbi:MAG TPA: ABC transporter substrate-binding protein [Acidimicrobiales bacterium]|nr:ABC transporter substrate-binding protein [Acidimicrobiales bacterium]